MPIEIPRYEKRTQGRGGPVPGVRVSADLQEAQALSGVAQAVGGLSEVGQQVVSFGEQVREEQEKAASMEAYTRLNGGMARLLDDPETGYINAKGKEALKRREDVLESFDKEVEAITKGLGTDRMKANFRQMVGQQRNGFRKSVDRHASNESNALYKATFVAALTGTQAKSFARVSRGEDLISPDSDIRKDMTTGTTLIEGEGLRNGTAPLEIAKQRRAFTTKAHIDILDDLLNRGETKQAREYLATYRDPEVIDEKALADAKIEARINAHSQEDARLVTSAALYDETQGDMGAYQNEAFKLFESGKITVADYDAIIQRGGAMRAANDKVRDARDAPAYNELVITLTRDKDFSDEDPRLLKLSREGVRRVKEKREGYRRASRAEDRDGLALQIQIEKEEWAQWNALPPFGPGQTKLNTDPATIFVRSREHMTDRARADQNKVKIVHRTDQGTGHSDFERLMKQRMKAIPKKYHKDIMTFGSEWYINEAAKVGEAKAPGVGPTEQAIQEKFDGWYKRAEDNFIMRDRTVIEVEEEAVTEEQRKAKGKRRPIRVIDGEAHHWEGTVEEGEWVREKTNVEKVLDVVTPSFFKLLD